MTKYRFSQEVSADNSRLRATYCVNYMAHTDIFEITLTSVNSHCFCSSGALTQYSLFFFSSTSANASFCKNSHWYIITYTHKQENLLSPPLIHWSKRNLSCIKIHSTDCSYWLVTTITLHVDWSCMVYSPDSRTGSCDLSKAGWPPCVPSDDTIF